MDEKLFAKINEFADGELSHQDEIFLFEQLAVDAEARNFFRKINLVRSVLEGSEEEFPPSLEKKILRKAEVTPERNFLFKYTGLAGLVTGIISIILLIISIFLLSEVSDYRKEINSVISQVKAQNKTIEALYNSLPPVDVKAVYSKEIIIKPKI
ncbi:MAG TPA: hypothetical protein VLB50_02470 [Ignavibacteriaceae bacterium]|nr:hypothetical protein [Ignavibacteriaceae bacterium]